MLWVQFLCCAALIVFAGTRLTVYADRLSERLSLGKVWIGIVLLGFVTSLPEVVTSLSAVIQLHATDLALGNMMGSNNFNLLLLVIMDMLWRRESVTNKIGYDQTRGLPAFFVILMTCIVIAELLLHGLGVNLALGTLSFGSLGILSAYFLGIKLTAQQQKDVSGGFFSVVPGEKGTVSIRRIIGNLVLSSLLVVGAAVWLSRVCDGIALETGLGRTFVGTMFLAMATSLPEMVVTISAVKMGGLDLAIGNIFGSNMTNIFIIFICDVFYPAGGIFAGVSVAHLLSSGLGIILVLVVLLGLRDNRKKIWGGLGWDSWLITALYAAGVWGMYQLR